MQDKSEYIFEKEFVDSSWNQMSGLLDDALPVPPSKKTDRRIVILLAFLLFLTTFIAAYYAYKFSSFIPNASLTKEKVIYKNIYIQQEASISDSDKKSISEEHKVNKNPVQQFTEELTPQFLNYSKTHTISISNSLSNANSNAQHEPFSLVDTRQAKVILTEQTDASENLFIEPFTPEARRKRKVRYNLGLLSLISHNSDYTGFGFTTGVELPIGKRIGIMTGVAINFISRDYYFIPHFPRINVIDESVQTLNEAATYYNGLRSFKQLYLPIRLSYKISDALAINSGIKLRYTYSETVKNGLPLPTGRRTVPLENYDTAFNNANIGLSAGISFSINDKFSILVDSEWGVGSIIRRAQITNPTDQNYDLNLVNLSTNFKF